MKKHHITKTRKQKQKSYYFGILAEFIAIIFLILKGYKILKRRNKTFVGEIDIIAVKRNYLVAIEVKARSFQIDPNEILSEYQKKRIKRAMNVFLSFNQEKFKDYGVRFDLVIVIPYRIPKHLIGFW